MLHATYYMLSTTNRPLTACHCRRVMATNKKIQATCSCVVRVLASPCIMLCLALQLVWNHQQLVAPTEPQAVSKTALMRPQSL